ncbi:hypothetical protein [Cellulomonas hominis]
MKRYMTAACAVATVLLAAGAIPAAADTSRQAVDADPATSPADTPESVAATYVDASGIVRYKFDTDEIPGATVRLETGNSSVDGTCSFSSSGKGSALTSGGPRLEVGAELSFDPDTCVREVAVASYPLDAAPAELLAEVDTPAALTSEHVSQTFKGTGAVGVLATWSGSLNARVQDPVGIHVSRTEAARTWNSSGGATNTNGWGWYTPSGWTRLTYSTANTSTATNTKGTFMNLIFCNPFGETHTNHSRTEFRGYTSGAWDWGYDMTKSGDCSALLSYHYTAVTP